jgi:hypothetical protein
VVIYAEYEAKVVTIESDFQKIEIFFFLLVSSGGCSNDF